MLFGMSGLSAVLCQSWEQEQHYFPHSYQHIEDRFLSSFFAD